MFPPKQMLIQNLICGFFFVEGARETRLLEIQLAKKRSHLIKYKE